MTANLPKLRKGTDIQVQEVQRISNKINSKKPTLKHFIIKLAKIKKKILKATRKKQVVICKCPPIRLSADFSAGVTILQSDKTDFKTKRVMRQRRSLYAHQGVNTSRHIIIINICAPNI